MTEEPTSKSVPPAAVTTAARLELRVGSRTEEVAGVRRAVERVAAEAGFDEQAVADLGLCVNEAMANVIRHAYGGAGDRPIAVTVDYPGDLSEGVHEADAPATAIRVTIRDWGSGVNPATLPAKPRDPLRPGGLGMICLRQLLDEVTFAPQPDGGLLLTLIKSRHRSVARRDGDGDGRSRAMSQMTTGSELVPAARRDGDALVAELRGEIDLHNSTELRTAVLDLMMKAEPKRLVLNLGQVPYMDSSGIAVLVEMLGRLRRAGGRVFLTNLQPRVKSILEIARLDTIFVVTADETAALAK